jgi:glycosyltransferase involved in cell wall biosynthesis
MKMDKPTWCIFLRSLPTGGVERQFIRLANLLSRHRRVVFVTLFAPDERVRSTLDSHVPLHVLFDKDVGNTSPILDLLRAPIRLRKIIDREQVDVIYSARELANLVSALAAKKRPAVRLLWGHRVSQHHFSRRIRLLLPILRWVQGRVHCQIANSQDGLSFYRSIGLCRGYCDYLPNFIDFEKFKFSEKLRLKQRESWALGESTIAIGIVGRIAPMKNHKSFLAMASRILTEMGNVRFYIIGSGESALVDQIKSEIDRRGISDQLMMESSLPMDALPSVYCGLDLLCSTSLYGEGFPNVVAEAMACDCPVVATDVGEARSIVGAFGEIVSPGDTSALTLAVTKCLKDSTSPRSGNRRRYVRSLCEDARILEQVLHVGEANAS